MALNEKLWNNIKAAVYSRDPTSISNLGANCENLQRPELKIHPLEQYNVGGGQSKMRDNSTQNQTDPNHTKKHESLKVKKSREESQESHEELQQLSRRVDIDRGKRCKRSSSRNRNDAVAQWIASNNNSELFTIKELLHLKSAIIHQQRLAIEQLLRKLARGKIRKQEKAPSNDNEVDTVTNSVAQINCTQLEARLTALEEKMNKLMEDLPAQIEAQVNQLLQSCAIGNKPTTGEIPKWKLSPAIRPKSNACSNYRKTLHGPNTRNGNLTNENEDGQLEDKLREMEKVVENLKKVFVTLLVKFGKLQQV